MRRRDGGDVADRVGDLLCSRAWGRLDNEVGRAVTEGRMKAVMSAWCAADAVGQAVQADLRCAYSSARG